MFTIVEPRIVYDERSMSRHNYIERKCAAPPLRVEPQISVAYQTGTHPRRFACWILLDSAGLGSIKQKWNFDFVLKYQISAVKMIPLCIKIDQGILQITMKMWLILLL